MQPQAGFSHEVQVAGTDGWWPLTEACLQNLQELALLVERQTHHVEDVATERSWGFDSLAAHLHGRLAQPGRAAVLHTARRGFKSCAAHHFMLW